jgi:hypothetical protein
MTPPLEPTVETGVSYSVSKEILVTVKLTVLRALLTIRLQRRKPSILLPNMGCLWEILGII